MICDIKYTRRVVENVKLFYIVVVLITLPHCLIQLHIQVKLNLLHQRCHWIILVSRL